MEVKPNETKQISPFFVFFLMPGMQIGVGILGFERIIAKESGQDAWISVLISGLIINVLLWMCFKLLGRGPQTLDLVAIHKDLFGKWVGNAFNILFILYFIMISIILIRTYLEVIQVWMFPGVNVLMLITIILILVYNFVEGGFRVITGFCIIGLIIASPLFLLNYFPLKYAHFENLGPLLDHSFLEIMKACKKMTLNYLGFELILIYYPFIKNREKSQKWAHLGALFTMVIYVVSILVSLAYYHQEQLKDVIWATLTLWKIVDLPFIERFEYIGISVWLFMVLPNVCLGVWAASRTAKRVFGFRQKKMMVLILIIILVSCIFLDNRYRIDKFNTISSQIGFYIVYLYLPLLFIWQSIVYKVRGHKS
ncbi:GerAB/ArcD/ProY family transporter [Peribacillus frigoritolerans]|uniref:GerAB/ArcD/ProY family transporter n=1 Tax=Peribacillus frigoritolerans TaxID=450367 RepID=UPI0024C0013E|nr:GerAB/ArcD/ProY family transporter [Peribacillus frigoritolerans]MEB2491352.1 GerAB/ArcD/ProY family transporter [Peribacillus frigoritolerans]WHY13823.1 GerAB/ArcD/ProY family transporter [Peribacillus frigoritolerans]